MVQPGSLAELLDHYIAFNNLVVPNGHGTRELDLVVLGRNGLFVIEAKHLRGEISGAESDREWQQVKRARHSGRIYANAVRNPVIVDVRAGMTLITRLFASSADPPSLLDPFIGSKRCRSLVWVNNPCKHRIKLPCNSTLCESKAMHTLIYCDIDGVLHRWPCKVEEMFDSVCIDLLERTLRDRHVGIVITSTWRLEWPLETLKARLGPLGSRVIGVTPEIEDPFVRHARYQEVLSHWSQQSSTPKQWIAIDDEPGRYPADLPNLILTNPATGLQRNDIAILEQLLNPDSPM